MHLRTQLLLLVGSPLLVLLLIETIVSYEIGFHTANQVFDRWLLDSAYSLAQEVRYEDDELRFGADELAIQIFGWDEQDHVYFRISALDGSLIAGVETMPLRIDINEIENGPVFGDITIDGDTVRAVSMLISVHGDVSAIVTVAETLKKRSVMAGQLMTEVLVSKAAFFVTVMILTGFAIYHGLKPLVQLSSELAQRSPQDLTKIGITAAPLDVRSLIDNTNRLLSKLDGAISSREQFIGNIAHQIRTPLAGIKLQAQIARREENMDVIYAALDRISHASDNLSHVNSQLMKLARAEAASGRGLRDENLDLVEVCRQVICELDDRAQEQGIRLDLAHPSSRPVEVRGEFALLREMVWNLIDNAIIYGRPGGNVWTKIDERDGVVTLSIEDDGPGISREFWPRIFERFFRPNPLGTEGCGLGLSIVREIAIAHGASVELEQPASGAGVCFVARFNESAV